MGAHLDGGGAHAAAPGVDEHRIPFGQGPQDEQGFVGGEEDLGYGCGLEEVPAVGDRHGHLVVDERIFGVAAPAHQAEDALPLGKATDGASPAHHLAGQFQPQDFRIPRRGWIEPHALEGVGPVEGRGAHPHQDVLRARLGHGHPAQSHHLRPAEAPKHNRVHRLAAHFMFSRGLFTAVDCLPHIAYFSFQ